MLSDKQWGNQYKMVMQVDDLSEFAPLTTAKQGPDRSSVESDVGLLTGGRSEDTEDKDKRYIETLETEVAELREVYDGLTELGRQ